MSSESLLVPNDEESKTRVKDIEVEFLLQDTLQKRPIWIRYYEAEELLEEIIVTERQIFRHHNKMTHSNADGLFSFSPWQHRAIHSMRC